ncbi:MAG TPA: DnaJ domain-containing protein [Polyangiaceae bacterium]|nr:DnaJ domain-containing protein [Polyangiaceae bacterium]
MSTPRPTATGSLDSTPFLNLLVYALDHRLTGTLVLEEAGGRRHAVQFQDGSPWKVKTAEPVVYLGQVLMDMGHLSEAVYADTLARAQSAGELHGQVLTRGGHLDPSLLRVGLREQLTRLVVYLAGRPRDTLYGYYDQQNLLDRWGGPDAPRGRPLEIIWRVAALHAPGEYIADVLSRLSERALQLHYDAPIHRFYFGRSEQAVLEVLRAKPQTLTELLGRDLAERATVERLIYVLALTRQFELSPDVLPLGADEAPSSTRPAAPLHPAAVGFGTPPLPPREGAGRAGHGSSPQVRALRGESPGHPVRSAEAPEITQLRAEILARADRVEESFYEVLGLAKDVPQAEVQPAFLALAKRWHPDRIPPELADLREAASRVFARMTEASQVLSDLTQRREYDRKVRRAGREAEEQEHVARVLRAATSFQKAEVFFKRNNLVAAEAEARQALTDDPEQADHIALLAWLVAQKPDANLEASIKELDRALMLQPNNVRVLWYRGQLYKRIGKLGRAMRDFRYVVERDPRHVDAQREIRLYNMRRGERGTSIPPSGGDGGRPSPAPSASDKPKSGGEGGGFISKLFKR